MGAAGPVGLGGLTLLAAIIAISVGEGGPTQRVPAGLDDVQRLIAGIPQDGDRLGEADAPVTISVFNDLLCASCADYQVETIDPLIESYAREGDARFELRHVAITGRETTCRRWRRPPRASGGDWQYADLAVRNLGELGQEVTEDFLREIADATPELKLEWSEDRPRRLAEMVLADDDLAIELDLSAPSVVVDGPAGSVQLEDSPSEERDPRRSIAEDVQA